MRNGSGNFESTRMPAKDRELPTTCREPPDFIFSKLSSRIEGAAVNKSIKKS